MTSLLPPGDMPERELRELDRQEAIAEILADGPTPDDLEES